MPLVNNKISFIRSKQLDAKQVIHGFFTRQGGVSKGIFDSLNCRSSSGDIPQNVKKNLSLVSSTLGYKMSDLKLLKQIHSNKVIDFTNIDEDLNLEGDALIVKNKHILLGVITADCVPVLIYDKENGVIAAIHAGWKGALSGIIQNTIKKMVGIGANLLTMTAAIGPCIRQNNYLVSNDFYDQFVNKNKYNNRYFKYNETQAQYSFNLPKYCYDILKYQGVHIIEDVSYDTYDEQETFFSCRRSKHQDESDFGGQISVIGLKVE